MANKKITQLNTVDTEIGIGSESMFPVASGSPTDTYITSKVSSVDIAKYVLNPMPVGGSTDLSSIGFTGSSNIKFKKTNWENANTNVEVNPYLQVRLSDGQLITGSGVAVPAALGDDLGDHTATEDLNLANYGVINTNDIFFGGGTTVSTRIEYQADPGVKDLKVQAERDLTLSGIRHVKISGQALDLVNTPISGNVTITGGNLEIDPGNKLTTNQIQVDGTASDYGSIEMSVGAIKPYSQALGGLTNVNWAGANISHIDRADDTTIKFYNVKDGQTYTMYMKNTDTNNPTSGTFLYTMGTSVSDATTGVHWGEVYDGAQQEYVRAAPTIAKGKTNIYTFVCIETGVFASAVTGYEY